MVYSHSADDVSVDVSAHVSVNVSTDARLGSVKYFDHMPAKFGFHQMRGVEFTVEADFIKCRHHVAFLKLA